MSANPSLFARNATSLNLPSIQDLPANLTELLEKYVEIALGRWDNKGIQQQIEWRIKQNLLGQLAWDLVLKNELAVSLGFFDYEYHEGATRRFIRVANLSDG